MYVQNSFLSCYMTVDSATVKANNWACSCSYHLLNLPYVGLVSELRHDKKMNIINSICFRHVLKNWVSYGEEPYTVYRQLLIKIVNKLKIADMTDGY